MFQGSPQDTFKAQWMSVVWVEFVTTSIIFATTSKRCSYIEGMGEGGGLLKGRAFGRTLRVTINGMVAP